MYFFRNDYGEGMHEKILEALVRTNREHTVGYGMDDYCAQARAAILAQLDGAQADIYFIPGGTQTNLLAISHALRPFEAVVCAATGHINVHETGAIEATGHKVLAVDAPDGKLTPERIAPCIAHHDGPHMVLPRMVYISDSTELGTVYTRAELEALRAFCDRHNLLLYLDGARLSSALTSALSDVTLADLARLTDCFYIGGTKSGALLGEALVLVNPSLQRDFAFSVKQRGAMFAKGRLLGLQFLTLFTDDLFFEIGRYENALAMELKAGIAAAGYRSLTDSPTNQQFPIFPDALVEQLAKSFEFETERRFEGETCIRLVTSWATPHEAVEAFLNAIQ